MNRLSSGEKQLAFVRRVLFSPAEARQELLQLSRPEFQQIASLVTSHHVVIRFCEGFCALAADLSDIERYEWSANLLWQEHARIRRAVSFLQDIFGTLSSDGYEVVVMKTLDHWPDFGSDVDLFTNSTPADVIHEMTSRFRARVVERSWGDRLANKWNFMVPGLPELIEIHVGRLGQTGELLGFAGSLLSRARAQNIGDCCIRVPAAEDRIMICTLQRMYRHFFIRLCDIADTMHLVETSRIDFDELQAASIRSGIWEGVATFLVVVSDLVESWRGHGLDLPEPVREAARFGGDQISFARGFLRVPILPHSVRLYASEWMSLMTQGEVQSTVRLSLLPWLATAAALQHKITGSDKGIW